MGRVSYNRKTVFEERQQKGLAFLQCVYDSSGLNFALPLHDVKKTPGRAGDNVLYFVVRSCGKDVFSPLYSGLFTFLPHSYGHPHNSRPT